MSSHRLFSICIENSDLHQWAVILLVIFTCSVEIGRVYHFPCFIRLEQSHIANSAWKAWSVALSALWLLTCAARTFSSRGCFLFQRYRVLAFASSTFNLPMFTSRSWRLSVVNTWEDIRRRRMSLVKHFVEVRYPSLLCLRTLPFLCRTGNSCSIVFPFSATILRFHFTAVSCSLNSHCFLRNLSFFYRCGTIF